MKNFIINVLATLVGLILYSFVGFFLFVGAIGIIASLSGNQEVTIKPNSILHLKFQSEIIDRSSSNELDINALLNNTESAVGLNEIIESIERAKTDPNIKGIFIDNDEIDAGMATLSEIREAIIDFKTSRKFVIAYGNDMSQGSYYLASAANKIALNPLGSLTFKGLRASVIYYKDALDKLGVEMQIFRHGKFKSAVEPYFLNKMSAENRQQYQVLLASIWNQILTEISASRSISKEQLNQIADSYAAYEVANAQKLRLIDDIKYRTSVLDELAEVVGEKNIDNLQLVSVKKYAQAKPASIPKQNKIAVIYASGNIERQESQSIYDSESSITPSKYIEALRTARSDSSVKAVVLRVNSPGGDALASDIIWNEVELTRQIKPIVVSMGDYAASGGYYISCAATKIIANASTLTGSIGVFGAFPNVQKLTRDKLGINVEVVKTNEMSDLGSSFRQANENERRIIQTSVENIYTTFVNRVSHGRGMTFAAVDEIGQGRVWSGVDAHNIGLIDDFGGITKAITDAANIAELDEYSILELPKEENGLESIMKKFGNEVFTRKIDAEFGEFQKSARYINSLIKTEGIKAQMEEDITIR